MATAHYAFYSTVTNKPSYCAAGKKAEKAIADVERGGLPYKAREVKKEQCPICYPKEAPADDPQQDEPAAIPAEPTKAGYCPTCGGAKYRLYFENRIMMRSCNNCGARLNLHTMEHMEALGND
jgi:hypothetical protein